MEPQAVVNLNTLREYQIQESGKNVFSGSCLKTDAIHELLHQNHYVLSVWMGECKSAVRHELRATELIIDAINYVAPACMASTF